MALGSYSSSPGTVYPALLRLEQRGLIEGWVDDGSTALRPRKVFRLSAAGEKVLRRWLLQPPSSDDVARRLDEVMLRFAFHAALDDRAATGRFLLVLARQIEAHGEELERQRAVFPAEAPLHPRLALEAGFEQYRTAGSWARRALEHFAEKSE